MTATDRRPVIAHVLHAFGVGGLERGVVNLINGLPAERFRHAVIALTEVTEFRQQIRRDDVAWFALNKRPGQGARQFLPLHRLFRRLAPAIVHTRNIGPLEAVLPAWLARVPVRVHGEHGWDVRDLDGKSWRYRLVRRAYRPFVTHYVAVSRHLEQYLTDSVGVAASGVSQIYNGVDVARFVRRPGEQEPIHGNPFAGAPLWLVGTVGRLQPVKDQVTLAQAFARALAIEPRARSRMRLVVVGDGPLRERVMSVLKEAGVADLAWLPGERSDVPAILGGLSCFVLPSLAEGVSNTLLEAMASELPVVATRVGGNAELVEDGLTGRLVPSASPESMAEAILGYFMHPSTAREHGLAARRVAETRFSLERMVADYAELYEQLLAGVTRTGAWSRSLRSSA